MLLKDFFYFTVPIFAVFVMSAKSFRLMSTRGWHRNLFQLRDKKNIIALDFDGVICASSGESSFSSIVAAKKYWPDVCDIQMNSTEWKCIQDAVSAVRPIVETGFENMLLVRWFFQCFKEGGKVDPNYILAKWSPALRDNLLQEYQTTRVDLVKAFGDIRDELIKEDLEGWVKLNEIYPCVIDSMGQQRFNFTSSNAYIITTKQERFVRAILGQNGILPPSQDRIFDLENPHGPKSKVLLHLLKEEVDTTGPRPIIHFIEDRFETLKQVLETPGLEEIKLYLVDWGYNTPEQREEARSSDKINLIDSAEFKKLIEIFRQ